MTDDISKCLDCSAVFSSLQKGWGSGESISTVGTFGSLRNSVVCYGTAS